MRSRGPLEALLLLLLAVATPLLSSASKYPYEPIEDLDETAYVGLWYQAYASRSVIWTFELGGNCVTATYYATDKPRTIRVLNQVRPFGELGGDSWWGDILGYFLTLDVNGYLSQSDEVDGQGYVELQPGPIPFAIGTPDIDDVMYMEPGNYWVIMLGPERDGEYQYSVVTNADQTQLYILVRNVDEFEERWADRVLWQLKDWGFTTPTNEPVKTNQEDCNYKYKDKDHYDDYYYDDHYYDDDYSKSKDKYEDDDW